MSQVGDFFPETNPYSSYIPYSQCLHIQDQKASGTAGGTAVVTSWNIRVLNTVVMNTLAGNSSPLSGNIITLLAGTYDFLFDAPLKAVGLCQNRIWNITDAVAAVTAPGFSTSTATVDCFSVPGSGRITIASTKTFRLESYCTSARATDGLGGAVSLGTEIYGNVFIWRVA